MKNYKLISALRKILYALNSVLVSIEGYREFMNTILQSERLESARKINQIIRFILALISMRRYCEFYL